MSRIRIKCDPELTSPVFLNGECKHNILLGRIKDSGRYSDLVQFDADQNFVVLEVGKRGSGKSFGMGAALEAFCTEEKVSSLGNHSDTRRGVLLLDPLDVHWTAIYPLSEQGSTHMQEQYKLLSRWSEVKIEHINVTVFMPAGKGLVDDPPQFKPFYLPVSDLTPDDFALLYGANLVSDPAGMLLSEIYDKVTSLGYTINNNSFPPKKLFDLNDLYRCLDDDEIQDPNRGYSWQTIRAVGQRLRSWISDPLFQDAVGTPITDLVKPGELSILCLNRLSEDMRSVITGVLVKKIKSERTKASQTERRIAFDAVANVSASPRMPRTILAIDEAQMIIPASGGGVARAAIESFILEGRNFGLSVWMATQRPKGAISSKAVSQLDTLIVHKLSSADDLQTVCDLLQATEPQRIKINDIEVSFRDLIRSLDVGMAIVSNDAVSRTFVMEVRPRVVAHGGKAF